MSTAPLSAEKRCKSCGEILPLTAFNRASRSHDGRAPACRECTNVARRRRITAGEKNELRAAIKNGNIDLVRSLCSAGRYRLDQLLAMAVQNYNTAPKNAGHVAIVDFLIDRGAVPSEGMLLEAARDGSSAIIERLLAAHAAPSIVASAAIGDIARVRSLLHRDPQLVTATVIGEASHYRDFTPLHACCLSALGCESSETAARLLEVGRLLVEVGADVEAIGVFYRQLPVTPLDMLAHSAGNLSLARFLLEQGAKITGFAFVEALGHRGRSLADGMALAQVLLDAGFDIDAMAWKGADGTALHAAANTGGTAAVEWLVARGANVNARGRLGRTPLHLAAERNTSSKSARVLIAAGADLWALDDLGMTPLAVAERHEKTAVARCLREAVSK